VRRRGPNGLSPEGFALGREGRFRKQDFVYVTEDDNAFVRPASGGPIPHNNEKGGKRLRR